MTHSFTDKETVEKYIELCDKELSSLCKVKDALEKTAGEAVTLGIFDAAEIDAAYAEETGSEVRSSCASYRVKYAIEDAISAINKAILEARYMSGIMHEANKNY